MVIARKRGRPPTPATDSNPPTPAARAKKMRDAGSVVQAIPCGWQWERGPKQQPLKADDGKTYYASVCYIPPPGSSEISVRVAVEDLVVTKVDLNDEETQKLNLKYWVGQVAALFEDVDGEKKFILRFFDQEAQWRYMNSDDQRLLKAFGNSFRRYEILETDVCSENPVDIIINRVNWFDTEAEAEVDNRGLNFKDPSVIPKGFFSDRMIVRCVSDGVRGNNLSDSLWPAPIARRRNRLIVQCRESLHSIRASKKYTGEYETLVSKDRTTTGIVEKAVEALKLSVLPEHLPCRETETGQIREFIKTAVASTGTSGNVLYISGVPGTGKTASVLSVVKSLKNTPKSPHFRFVYINAMKLNKPTDLFSELLYELEVPLRSGERAEERLTKLFASKDAKRPVTVLLLDEIDFLVTKSQQVVYQLFDWPLLQHSKLVLLTISNTMDLPERLMPRVASRLGLARLNYLPYNHQQIEEVIVRRLTDAGAEKLFAHAALQFVARKVANSTGDIRKALHICRRAIELRAADQIVNVPDANKAQFDLYSNPLTAVMSGLCYFSRMVLTALVMEAKVDNTDSVSLTSLWSRFDNIAGNYQPQYRLRPLTYSDFVRLLDELKRLAILSTMKNSVDTGDDADGSGFLVSLNTLLDYPDVKHALVEAACDAVAQRLL